MKTLKIFALAVATVLAGVSLGSCSDACEYLDENTSNPSWVQNYNDSTKVPHPETLAGTNWVRQSGMKVNAFGQDVQGFVESIKFVSADSCIVKMSEGSTKGTWVDESNTTDVPKYSYEYSEKTGAFNIKKSEKDDKGKVSLKDILVGVAVSGSRDIITVAHFGDNPVQSYLVKQ
ncbi:MAG: hypothetical protein MJZ12_06375 [Prevotella sp.]|nr:hypothetical protein [Prevotella sp.]